MVFNESSFKNSVCGLKWEGLAVSPFLDFMIWYVQEYAGMLNNLNCLNGQVKWLGIKMYD